MEAIDRDPAGFDFVGQVTVGRTPGERREALDAARGLLAGGASHVVFGVPSDLGPAALDDIARDVVAPLHAEVS